MKTLVTKPSLLSHSLLTVTATCALACLPFAQAPAQDAPAVPPQPAAEASTAPEKPAAAEKKLTAKEVLFIKKAGAGNEAEAKVGELATSNAESQDVKDFGAKMTKDHGDANTDLSTVAKAHDIAFPPEEMEKQKMMYDKLSKLHGAEFDKTYVKDMVADHEKDLAEYKMEKSEATDPELKAYVEKTEPIVAEHLKLIKEIESKMMSDKKS
jgi:putative membrane protein